MHVTHILLSNSKRDTSNNRGVSRLLHIISKFLHYINFSVIWSSQRMRVIYIGMVSSIFRKLVCKLCDK